MAAWIFVACLTLCHPDPPAGASSEEATPDVGAAGRGPWSGPGDGRRRAAACQEKKKGGKIDKVKVTVVVILASEEGNVVDKNLKAIAEEVRKLNPQLKSFRLKSMMNKSLAPEEKASFALVEDKLAIVVVKHGADGENRVGVAVTVPNQGEIEYRTVCGKFLPIVTRYQTKSRERLILAICVRPCMGD